MTRRVAAGAAARDAAAGGESPERGPNWWSSDEGFRRLLRRNTPADAFEQAFPLLRRMGELAPTFFAPRARLADRHRPTLVVERLPDGREIDRIVYHPSYREMVREAYGFGLVRPVGPDGRPFPATVKFALGYLFAQAEAGLYCPVACTDGAAQLLERFAHPSLAGRFVPRLVSTDVSVLLQGAMFMTERSGGSDLSAVATVAQMEREGDGSRTRWRLRGEKWFCSNVDADVILTIARTGGPGTRGLSMFVVPGRRADGAPNDLRIRRLKDKLGVASMATGEVVYEGAEAYLLGEVGKGIRYAAELFNLSRMYNSIASVGVARRALREAATWCETRVVFGRRLAEQPLAQQDLGRLAIELQGHLALVFHTVRSMDAAQADARSDDGLARVLTPLVKLTTARFAVRAASTAIELLGGNGYVEDADTPRLLRDAQVLPIWEGSTNVLVLDAVRALRREGALDLLLDDASRRLPARPELGDEVEALRSALGRVRRGVERSLEGDEGAARVAVEALATTLQAALLIEAAAVTGPGSRETRAARHFVRSILGAALARVPLDPGSLAEDLPTLVEM